MTLYLTYCSADKDARSEVLPAIERYRSVRIQYVHALAQAAERPFRILSGEFALLSAKDPIPWYDHLLLPAEADELAKRVAQQLLTLGIDHVVFHSRGLDADPRLQAYHRCMELACAFSGSTLTIRIIE